MESPTTKIQCPNCGTEINVNEILYHQLEKQLKSKFDDELAKQQDALSEKESALQDEKKKLEKRGKTLQSEIDAAVKLRIEESTKDIETKAKIEAQNEQSEQIKTLQAELAEKSTKVIALHKSEAENERLKREMSELEDKYEAENEKKLNETLKQQKEQIQKDAAEKSQLKISELEEVIGQLSKQLQEAHRKAEQGSMQLQGEVQELAIERWLEDTYPMDSIQEIKKGTQGADCLQTVNTHERANCGTIYYESKRTKAFQPAWIEKFKEDIREKSADIGVLVTATMPNDLDRMGLKDGIWICSFDEFKGLSSVLRQTVIEISIASASQENKGTKMEMLYDFLTGTEFRQQVEAIVEGFTQMKSDLDSEKRAFQAQWKKREKQIDKVILNTINMHSSIKGIAGNAIQPVALLDIPTAENDMLST